MLYGAVIWRQGDTCGFIGPFDTEEHLRSAIEKAFVVGFWRDEEGLAPHYKVSDDIMIDIWIQKS